MSPLKGFLMKKMLICSFLVMMGLLFAQQQKTPYNLIHSDSLRVVKEAGEFVTNLIGNVHFFYGDTEFKADFARMRQQPKTAFLQGNVYVNDNDTLQVYADEAEYRREVQQLIFSGNVEAYNDTLTLFANHATYWQQASRLHAVGDVLMKQVHSDSTQTTIECATMNYFRRDKRITGEGDVRFYNEEDHLHAQCGYVEYDIEAGYGYMIKKPVLYTVGKDSIYIEAGKLEFFEQQRKLLASFNVLTRSTDYNTRSDFLIYMLDEEKALFIGQPEFYSEFADGIASEFHIYFKERKIIRAELIDSCYIEFTAEEGKPKDNRVSSDLIEFDFFDSGYIRLATATGNVDSYMQQDESKKKDFFVNKASGKEMIITVNEDNKIDMVVMKNKVSGNYKFKDKNN
ncbi:MAG: hypothetical protein K8S56_05415 [Candidatus Cloacimonetes bacterium]|nr:hypothetical protein [Candidatus Cloacimonadota bacterium]